MSDIVFNCFDGAFYLKYSLLILFSVIALLGVLGVMGLLFAVILLVISFPKIAHLTHRYCTLAIDFSKTNDTKNCPHSLP